MVAAAPPKLKPPKAEVAAGAVVVGAAVDADAVVEAGGALIPPRPPKKGLVVAGSALDWEAAG